MDYPKEEQQVFSDRKQPKKTVVIGASPNQDRYAYMATARLKARQHPVVPIGIKKGSIEGEEIINLKEKPDIKDVDTVTIYLNPAHQSEWEEYLLSLKPKRIIFNPGTENLPFSDRAQEQGIETINACTLTMLSVGNY